MYVHTYTHIYLYILYIYIYIYVYILHLYTRNTFVYIHIYTHTQYRWACPQGCPQMAAIESSTGSCIHSLSCIRRCVYIHMIYMYIHTYIDVNISLHICIHLNTYIRTVSMGVPSDGSYRIEPGLEYSFPVIDIYICIYLWILHLYM